MSSKPLPIFCDVHRQSMEMIGYRWGMSLRPPRLWGQVPRQVSTRRMSSPLSPRTRIRRCK
jgi:hypothetical protein